MGDMTDDVFSYGEREIMEYEQEQQEQKERQVIKMEQDKYFDNLRQLVSDTKTLKQQKDDLQRSNNALMIAKTAAESKAYLTASGEKETVTVIGKKADDPVTTKEQAKYTNETTRQARTDEILSTDAVYQALLKEIDENNKQLQEKTRSIEALELIMKIGIVQGQVMARQSVILSNKTVVIKESD